ncbi:MAG: hypothetical protein K2X66_13000 [Cyanobacteria bacterium]|nr:hypothetical protein [Cyanobacteriota bacterium]
MFVGPYIPPFILKSDGPNIGLTGVVNKSVDDYYSWGNIKNRTFFELAAGGISGDDDSRANSLTTAAAAYGAMTVGEFAIKKYSHLLEKYTNSHPQFEEYRNTHPILGNILAWTPGVAFTAAIGAGAYKGVTTLLQKDALQGLLRNPTVGKVIGIASLVGLAATSFFGLFARNGVKNLTDYSKDYKEGRKENPNLDPKALQQLVTAQRNQKILAVYQAQQAERQRALYDPGYRRTVDAVKPSIVDSHKTTTPFKTFENTDAIAYQGS